MKHLDPNDPQFTAKALGENQPESIDPQNQSEFDELQDFTNALKADLKKNAPKDALDQKQIKVIKSSSEEPKKNVFRFPVWMGSLAACLLVGAFAIYHIVPEDPVIFDSSELDRNLEPMTLKENKPVRRHEPDLVLVSDEKKERQLAEEKRKDAADRSRQQSAKSAGKNHEEEMYELSSFEVTPLESDGYTSTSTLAGTRMKTSLRDVGSAISVYTEELLEDVDTTDNETLLSYSTNTALEGAMGTYATGGITPNANPSSPIPDFSREAYDRIVENAFKSPTDNPLSTFSIDVDTASYANIRRFLNNRELPRPDAVRIEEMVNYFKYDYPKPEGEHPFAVQVDSASAPWKKDHRLVRIALQGDVVTNEERPDANLVFLLDVSGSMSNQNKLPLVKESLDLLIQKMDSRDRIAIVVYAGASGLALPSTTANNQETIKHALNNLQSGGSTNGGAGIELAYTVAQKHFIDGGINRVILCTDGDFNVGNTDRGGLTRLIEDKAKSGVFFSVAGFGMGNYQDATMEELSNKGNGNYAYIDSKKEARKVFEEDLLGTLFTIAKDVKIQVEFNPAQVAAYRLIGYENRMLAKEDFNDDTKDAGEIGAGHRVTALYEIVPTGVEVPTTSNVDELKYQVTPKTDKLSSPEILTVKLRYKQPDGDVSQLLEVSFKDPGTSLKNASDDFRFAASVAGFGMLLRHSEYTHDLTLEEVLYMAQHAKGKDEGGLRSEFVELVEQAIALQPEKK